MIDLFPHQRKVLETTKGKNRVAYYLDMGLGKTFVGSEKMLELDAKVNLLVCQKSKVQDWIDHFEKFYGYPGNLETGCSPYYVIDLTKWKPGDFKNEDKFITELIAGQIIYVINYELAWRRKDLLNLKHFTLMLDESSLIQNEKSKRAKFIMDLNPENVILLSGTPTDGKYERLWSQLHLLGWGISKELYMKQYSGNYYFSSFDHWIKEEKHIKHYFRYMDDIVIFAETKEELHALKEEIAAYFHDNLKLAIKGNWQIFPTYVRGIDYLGYRTFLNYSLLRKSTCNQMKTKLSAIREKVETGNMMLLTVLGVQTQLMQQKHSRKIMDCEKMELLGSKQKRL